MTIKKEGFKMPTFREIQKLVYKEYLKNGYEENWNLHKNVGDIAELGLIISEVAEAMEILRSKYFCNNPKKQALQDVNEECADVIIRTMNFCSRKGLDLEFAILGKNKKNLERSYLHGKKV